MPHKLELEKNFVIELYYDMERDGEKGGGRVKY